MKKDVTEAAATSANNGQTVAGAEKKCPVAHGARGRRNDEWWPDALNISILHRNASLSDPMGEGFDYA
jgi:catalase-peroxidase